MIEFGHLSHPGRLRALNEDTYHGDASLGLWLVADGMGGPDGGEVASALAREAIVRQVRSGATLEAAIRQADAEILAASRKRRDPSAPMGTTVVCARLQGDAFELAWVGDSRAYLWQSGRLTRLGAAPAEVPAFPPRRPAPAPETEPARAVNQALGVTDASHLIVATLRLPWKEGMQLLLCSDGLTEELGHAQIAVLLGARDCSAQESVEALVAAALEAGGKDNITALLLRAL